MAEAVFNSRSSKSFEEMLAEELPFKIAVLDSDTARQNPHVFQTGKAEYGAAVDTWLAHELISPAAEVCVRAMDLSWLTAVKVVCEANVHINQQKIKGRATVPDVVVSLWKVIPFIV